VCMNCDKDSGGKIVIETGKRQNKEVWRKYMEKLLNEENTWHKDTICGKVGTPCQLLQRYETENIDNDE